MSHPDSRMEGFRGELIVVGAITFLTLFVYGQTARHEFVDVDYTFYTGNPHIQQGVTAESLRWVATAVVGSNWHPVTMFTHMLIHEFFGASTAAHHLTNVFFHLANALMVFALLRRTTGTVWRSGIVALLFSLHPLRTESVAWTGELKDVLSAFWALLALLAYARFVATRHWRWYAAIFPLFVLALLSKASTLTLPVMMLCLDYWPLARFRGCGVRGAMRLLAEKLPFFALGVGMSAITIFTFSDTTLKATAFLTPVYRSVMALQAYLAYLVTTAIPTNLVPHYPYVQLERPLIYAILPLCVLGVITVVAVWQWRTRPYLLSGWIWFIAVLAPVSGILPIGSHYRADRYTYLPHIGLFIAIVWTADSLREWRPRLQRPIQALAAISILAYSAVTYVNVGYWRDGMTLFSRGVKIAPNSSLLHSGLASAYIQRKEYDLAEQELRASLYLNGDQPIDMKRLGSILLLKKRSRESVPIFAELVRLQPQDPANHHLLALALKDTGDYVGARTAAERALALEPGNKQLAIFLSELPH